MEPRIRDVLDAVRREVRRTIAGNAVSFGQLAGPVASPRQALAFMPKAVAAYQIGEELRHARPGRNDARDAARHAELSRRMTEEIGPVSSGLIGLEHEIQGALLGQPLPEAVMDMINNREGIRAGLYGRSPDPRRLQTAPIQPGAIGARYQAKPR